MIVEKQEEKHNIFTRLMLNITTVLVIIAVVPYWILSSFATRQGRSSINKPNQ